VINIKGGSVSEAGKQQLTISLLIFPSKRFEETSSSNATKGCLFWVAAPPPGAAPPAPKRE